MKRLTLSLLLLMPAVSFSQSLFDGGWIFDEDSVQQSEKPKAVTYFVAKGILRCSDCFANPEINADGRDQKVHETSYWDTVSARIVDAYTVEIIAKKAGKTMYTETDKVSPTDVYSPTISAIVPSEGPLLSTALYGPRRL